MSFDSVKSVEQFLQHIPKFQSVGSSAAKFDLSRFKDFCKGMGNPQDNFPSIHVAGTNGKGSVCHILGSVFQDSGYKVGVYTSPHIIEFKERFRIDDEYIPDDDLITFFREYGDQIKEHQLTYFEISTAIAFWWFEQSKVDIAIIEVGLGGRLDATNIINPLVSVITSISLDHTDILGSTLKEIAREKGGIIKPKRPVVIGALPEEAKGEIFRLAEQKGAAVNTIDELHPKFDAPGRYQMQVDGQNIDIRSNLTAPVQAKNIAIAWQVVDQLEQQYPAAKQQFKSALGHVKLGLGRFEKLAEKQPWYFDGGHNLEAIQTMKQSIETVGELGKATLVLSIMKDKIQPEVMAEFSEFKNIYYYPLSLERAATFNDIKQWMSQAKPFPDDQRQQLFLDKFDSELVIFSGSFYFYDTVRGWVSMFA